MFNTSMIAAGGPSIEMISEKWRLLQTGDGTGHENMALDDALANAAASPTLRVYGWSQTCLSLGRYQTLAPTFTTDQAPPHPRVRRPTGGRAILHQPQEVTYSLTVPSGHWLATCGVIESYRRINEALIAGLQTLGVPARATERSEVDVGPDRSIACFERTYRHEVAACGGKIVASAQSRVGGGVLQQGTIAFTETGREFSRHVADTGSRTELARRIDANTMTLEKALGRPVTRQQAESALYAGFEEAWGVSFDIDTPTEEEREYAERLFRVKYEAVEWLELGQSD